MPSAEGIFDDLLPLLSMQIMTNRHAKPAKKRSAKRERINPMVNPILILSVL